MHAEKKSKHEDLSDGKNTESVEEKHIPCSCMNAPQGCTSTTGKKITQHTAFTASLKTTGACNTLWEKYCADPGHITGWESTSSWGEPATHTRTDTPEGLPSFSDILTLPPPQHHIASPRQGAHEETASDISFLDILLITDTFAKPSQGLSWVGIQIQALPIKGCRFQEI